MFRLENVKFKNILNIEDVTFPKGKITTIIGKSGSGKTTLLKMFNKLISPDSGSIFYENKNLADFDSIQLRREVLMLQQNPLIFDGNIRENLLMGLVFSEKPPVDDELLKDTLKSLNLDKGLEDETKNLSGGEKQRLALGRLIIMKPKVLLLDEPTSALDEESQIQIGDYIKKIYCKEDLTVIMVSHSMSLTREYSDYIYNISENDFSKNERR